MDRDAHAWVEAWFAGVGWVPFDPTPGRGTFGGTYSFASTRWRPWGRFAAASSTSGGSGTTSRRGGGPTGGSGDGSLAPVLLRLTLVLGVLWVVVIGGWKTLRRRARYLTRDPRRVATVSRQELEAFLRDQGVAVAAGATLEELRRVVGVELGLDMRAFTTAVARGRFGPPAEAGRDPFAPRRELKALLRAIRFRALRLGQVPWARLVALPVRGGPT